VIFTPPKRTSDLYGHITLSPQVPSTGAGIATLNPIPEVPRGDVDLIAPLGTIDAGEAGIRSSGNVNLVALQIVNAANIQAQGNVTGVPTVQAPNIGSLTEASNTAGAAQQVAKPAQTGTTEQPSIIIVEFVGFGGGNEEVRPNSEQQRNRGRQSNNNYDSNGMVRVLGNGTFSAEDTKQLTTLERDTLARQMVAPSSP
jgi:Filamentous haemagglutinin family outer membrane protein